MNGYSSVQLIGRITSDIEMNFLGEKQTAVCKFAIANNRKYGGKEEAHYFDVELWGDRAVSFAKFHEKGSPACVIGELRQSRWKDKATGVNRSRVVIAAHTWVLLPDGKQRNSTDEPDRKADRSNQREVERTSGPGAANRATPGMYGGDEAQSMNTYDDDIPF